MFSGGAVVEAKPGFAIADFDHIEPDMCPCGPSRRAFVDGDGTPSLHRVEIQKQDQPHRHQTGEIYYILSCGPNAAMMLDGKRHPVLPGIAIKIRGGVMHCADRGGEETMVVLVYVDTGHGSPETKMEFPPEAPNL